MFSNLKVDIYIDDCLENSERHHSRPNLQSIFFFIQTKLNHIQSFRLTIQKKKKSMTNKQKQTLFCIIASPKKSIDSTRTRSPNV